MRIATNSFDVPDNIGLEDVKMTPDIRRIADEFKVTIHFKRRENRRPLALVKGTRDRGRTLEVAASRLLEYWSGNGDLPSYTLQADLPITAHSNMIGKAGVNIRTIMTMTRTTIRFPKSNQDSAVFISGLRDDVKAVWMYLQGLLSVWLEFELSTQQSEGLLQRAESMGTTVNKLLENLEVSLPVTISAKSTGSIITVSIKGVEAATGHLYDARARIISMTGYTGDNGQSMLNTDATAFDLMTDDPDFAPPVERTTQMVAALWSSVGSIVDTLWAKGVHEAPANQRRHATHESAPNQNSVRDAVVAATHTPTGVNGAEAMPASFSKSVAPAKVSNTPNQSASLSPDQSPSHSNTSAPLDLRKISRQHMQGIESPLSQSQNGDMLSELIKQPDAAPTSRSSADVSTSLVPESAASTKSGANGVTPGSGEDLILSPGGGKGLGTFQNSVVQPWKPAEEQRRVADEAIRNADLTQARIPTGYWAGGGLSRSMPESELKRIAKATRAGLGSGNVMMAVSESVDGRSSDSPRTSPALARVGSNSGTLQTGPSPTDRGRSGAYYTRPHLWWEDSLNLCLTRLTRR